jgi:putative DNA primase/helicase
VRVARGQPACRALSVNAAEVAARLGHAYRSGSWWRCRCPVHSSAGATLSLKDGNWGLIAHCHAGCRRTDIITELRQRRFLDTRSSAQDPATKKRQCEAEDVDRRGRIAFAMDVWRTSYPARGTIVEAYLRSRGLTMPVPWTLRMHGQMWHCESGERRPAMVALVEHSKAGPVGVHITYLNPLDPSVKVSLEPRKRLIGPVTGAAIRLAEVRPDRALIVGEGIESTLSLMQLRGLPGWAAVSTAGLRALVLTPAVRRVLIAVDRDANGAGEAAARDGGRRWILEDREVRLAMPPGLGDFNDIVQRGTSNGIQCLGC